MQHSSSKLPTNIQLIALVVSVIMTTNRENLKTIKLFRTVHPRSVPKTDKYVGSKN